MKMGRGGAVHRDLGQLFEGRSIAGLGEVQLLERFVERRDDSAFAALVSRHGPMVLGVCRRLLADPLDVEDAFQATFLVLVRRAGSLRERDRLAPWLFGVARKVATRARVDLARRRAREGSGAEELAAITAFDDQRWELGRALIEEIDRLPESLRDPIVLCCVEGLTYDEAASRLQTTAPAIRGKLGRARERLRDRLTRRGFAPSATALGALLTSEAVSAAVPARMLMTTIQLAKAGTFPAGVKALAEGVILTMILTKSKILAVALVACGVAGSSMSLNAQQAPPQGQNPIGADRFTQIEKKLDRLIEALEGSNRSRDPFGQPAAMAPAAPVPPQPPVAAPPGAIPTAPGGMMGMFRGTGGMAVSAPAASRLDAVEQRLDRLEARLSKLERRLGSEDAAENDAQTIDPTSNRPVGLPRRSGNEARVRNRSADTSLAPAGRDLAPAGRDLAPAGRDPNSEQPK
jgi:RNA polymerase sigma factor (sigma-70 family)